MSRRCVKFNSMGEALAPGRFPAGEKGFYHAGWTQQGRNRGPDLVVLVVAASSFVHLHSARAHAPRGLLFAPCGKLEMLRRTRTRIEFVLERFERNPRERDALTKATGLNAKRECAHPPPSFQAHFLELPRKGATLLCHEPPPPTISVYHCCGYQRRYHSRARSGESLAPRNDF